MYLIRNEAKITSALISTHVINNAEDISFQDGEDTSYFQLRFKNGFVDLEALNRIPRVIGLEVYNVVADGSELVLNICSPYN